MGIEIATGVAVGLVLAGWFDRRRSRRGKVPGQSTDGPALTRARRASAIPAHRPGVP